MKNCSVLGLLLLRLTQQLSLLCFFFFNDTATTEIYTLSLHDALPICYKVGSHEVTVVTDGARTFPLGDTFVGNVKKERSEEHTSELQSHVNLVCRLLLEKKKKSTTIYTKNC